MFSIIMQSIIPIAIFLIVVRYVENNFTYREFDNGFKDLLTRQWRLNAVKGWWLINTKTGEIVNCWQVLEEVILNKGQSNEFSKVLSVFDESMEWQAKRAYIFDWFKILIVIGYHILLWFNIDPVSYLIYFHFIFFWELFIGNGFFNDKFQLPSQFSTPDIWYKQLREFSGKRKF